MTDGSLDEQALAALAHDLRTSTGRLVRALREQGGRAGLTPSQTEALGYLARDGAMTVTALAGLVGVRSQSIGATVAALEEQGLVTVAADPADGRRKVITPTTQAHELVTRSRTVREDWLAQRIAATLSPAEQHRLQEAVVLLARLSTA